MRFFRLSNNEMRVGWGLNHVKWDHLSGFELTLSIPLWIFPKREYFDDFRVKKGCQAIRLLFYLSQTNTHKLGWQFEISLWRVPVGKQRILVDFYRLLDKRIAILSDLFSCCRDKKFVQGGSIASWVFKHYNKQEWQTDN